MLKNSTELKMERQLATLENQYRELVKINPQSFNATVQHKMLVEKCVRDMKRIRNSKTICRPVKDSDVSWLQQIIDTPPTPQNPMYPI